MSLNEVGRARQREFVGDRAHRVVLRHGGAAENVIRIEAWVHSRAVVDTEIFKNLVISIDIWFDVRHSMTGVYDLKHSLCTGAWASIPWAFLNRFNHSGLSAEVWFHGSSSSYRIRRDSFCSISSVKVPAPCLSIYSRAKRPSCNVRISQQVALGLLVGDSEEE